MTNLLNSTKALDTMNIMKGKEWNQTDTVGGMAKMIGIRITLSAYAF